ncbi:peptide methionine sulfoxide reductase A5 [Selaginella moellendorffii]|nr:peptide methionine sulfoxide reductase A5 [Selaginella moellendorffii]|eukprot:XP_002981944.2 peptide methionine sulfoxide reductase A5 [Selaginella moellendorffii]
MSQWLLLIALSALALALRPGSSIRVDDPPAMDPKIAVFAVGSFWSGEAAFGCIPGVVRTRVGYCGGSKQSPEYRNIGDHAESVEIEYDPARVRYEQLLDAFWAAHDPTQVFGQGPDVGEQYRSIIFTQNEDEAFLATVSKEREQAKRPYTMVATEIEPLETFYPAELEHQKFELRRRPLLLQLFGELAEEDFVRSSAAARFNGYAAGMCPAPVTKELDSKVSQFMRHRQKLSLLFQ